MIQYNYLEGLTIQEINEVLGASDNDIIGIVVHDTPQTFDVFTKWELPEKTMVVNGSQPPFYFVRTITIGEGLMLTFFTLFFFIFLGKSIYKFIFK